MRTKLNSIFFNDKKKDGTPYVDKNGQPFKMAVIDTTDGKASMFCGKFQANDLIEMQQWQKGQEIDVIFEKSGEYMNFKLPTKTDLLEERVKLLENAVFGGQRSSNATSATNTPTIAPQQATEGEINPDDIPF